MLRVTTLLVLVLGLTSLPPLFARDPDPYAPFRADSQEPDVETKEWQEAEGAEIPPLPDDDGFTLAQVDEVAEGFQILVATGSYSINQADRVARFWVALRSRSGTMNYRYEGLRCDTEEYKTYAVASRRGTPMVRQVENPQWAPIGIAREGNWRLELRRQITCEGTRPKAFDQVVQSLRGRYESKNPYSELLNSSIK